MPTQARPSGARRVRTVRLADGRLAHVYVVRRATSKRKSKSSRRR